jgi:uncharacterized C2H2 Zn-finger protein
MHEVNRHCHFNDHFKVNRSTIPYTNQSKNQSVIIVLFQYPSITLELKWKENDLFQNVLENSRELECDQCHKQFGRNRDLKRHVDRIHLKVKTFGCKECDLSFVYNRNLEKHNLRAHGDVVRGPRVGTTVVECQVCDRKFCYKQNLRKHLTKAHGLNVEQHQVTAPELMTGSVPAKAEGFPNSELVVDIISCQTS